MSRFLDKRYYKLAPYVPGEQPQDKKYIKLNTNESPFEPSPKVVKALNSEEVKKLYLYNDPTALDLRNTIAEYYGVKAENVAVGNGSDEILAFAFNAFCGKDTPMVCPKVSYGFYPVFCEMFSLPYVAVDMKEDLSIDIGKFYDADGNVTIANPNAQTGTLLDVNEIEKLLRRKKDNVVIVDEAYIDFGGESCLPLIKMYDNLLVVRTFSKSRNMAGARLGYAIGSKGIIEDVEKMKYSFNPYNVNRLTQLAGIEAIRDDDYFKFCTNYIKDVREYTVNKLSELGCEIVPSKANFILVKLNGTDGENLYKKLKNEGILVRFLSDAQLKDYVRITIGKREMTDILVAKIKEIKRGLL